MKSSINNFWIEKMNLELWIFVFEIHCKSSQTEFTRTITGSKLPRLFTAHTSDKNNSLFNFSYQNGSQKYW
jgi:hypothetical protein